MVVVTEVGQVVREVGEVVADANFQVFPEVTRYCSQRTAAALVQIRHIEQSTFHKQLPVLPEPVVTTDYVQTSIVVEELIALSIQADLAEAISVFAADRDVWRNVVDHVDCCYVAFLNELSSNVLQSYLVTGRHVVEVGVLH